MPIRHSNLHIGRDDGAGNILTEIRKLHSHETITGLRLLGWEIHELEVESVSGGRGSIAPPSAKALELAVESFAVNLSTGNWDLVRRESFYGLVLSLTYQID